MLRPRSASDSDLPAPMANDWSQPDAAERELARRERERRDGEHAHPDLERVLGAVHAVLESQLSARGDTARLADDLAALRAQLASRPAEGEEAGALATRLAEAEGRLGAQVAHLKTHVQDVGDALPDLLALARSAAATPGALAALGAVVGPLGQAVRAHTRASKELGEELTKQVSDAETALTERIAEEAKHVRETLDENTALVRRRRRRSRRLRLGLAGAVLLGLLGCFAAGVWLQWKHAPVPVPDPSKGWRDYIWYEYGPAVRDCVRKARESGRAVNCLIAPPS